MSKEVINMKSRGFICVNAHPGGCARNTEQQVEHIKQSRPAGVSGPRNVLVIGASTGYGLASRIVAAWGFQARTLGISLEREPQGSRTATAGFYNTAAFHQFAKRDGLAAWSINDDAFSDETKRRAAALIHRELGSLDLVIYSLASPKRTHPRSGQTHQSVLKPIGQSFASKTIELNDERVTQVVIEPANETQIADTVQVMGGEDWRLWIEMLLEEKLLAPDARTLAYSYIGPELTWPVYRDGTIGQAKKDLDRKAGKLDALLQKRLGGHAWVSVNKAIVTQASAAIPVVPLYMSILSAVMKRKGLEEGAIEQMGRLFFEFLAVGRAPNFDEHAHIRLDDREMRTDVQAEVREIWPKVNTENLRQLTDFAGFKRGFRNIFGFDVEGVDYSLPVETQFRF